MEILFLAVQTSFLLFLWFHTDFVAEYANLLGLSKTFKTEEYKTWKKSQVDPNYPNFIEDYKNCFITRLLACPICSTVCFSFFVSIILAGCLFWVVWFLIAFFSLVLFFILKVLYKLSVK